MADIEMIPTQMPRISLILAAVENVTFAEISAALDAAREENKAELDRLMAIVEPANDEAL